MASNSPEPISDLELKRRRSRALRMARDLGFVGRVEYRHVYSQAGGAQYGRGTTDQGDLLTVYAEAFERDADPEDFSLLAIVAHERGHQLLARHPRLSERLDGVSRAAEEVLASLLGALTCGSGPDGDALVGKATAELLSRGTDAENAVRLVGDLLRVLGALL